VVQVKIPQTHFKQTGGVRMRIKALAIGLVLSQLPTASIASTAGDELPLAASRLVDSTDFN
jgi:hypothetical protein